MDRGVTCGSVNISVQLALKRAAGFIIPGAASLVVHVGQLQVYSGCLREVDRCYFQSLHVHLDV